MAVQAESGPAGRWHPTTTRTLNDYPKGIVARTEAVRASEYCAMLTVAERMQPQAGWIGWPAATVYAMEGANGSGKHIIRQRGVGVQLVFRRRG